MKATPSSSDLPKLSAPARRALAGAGIMRLRDLSKFTECEIAKLHGIGPNALGALKEAMTLAKIEFKEMRNEK